MVDFNDTKTAFALKSDNQLRKAYWLFKLVASKSLVSIGKGLSDFSLRLGLPIKGLVKQTVYDQFVGGESIEECAQIVQRLYEYKVHSILDFAVEGKETETDFEACKDEILKTIVYGSKHESIPIAVFKVTGVAKFSLLEKVSANEELNIEENAAWERVQQRIEAICATAYEHKIMVMIDAEESWIQPAIDKLCHWMMQRFNKEEVWVVNTLQMYRKDRLDFLKESLQNARKEAYRYGAKLVRGAYMEKERERAEAMSYPDPICDSKADSDANYNAALEFMMENIADSAVVAGSHNEGSARLLSELIDQKGLDRSDKRVWFSQLYGMSDNLSFNLGKEGYNVVKYLPFGPVKETLPYLIRRAEENSSAGGQSGRELSLIQAELKRRKAN